MLYFSTQELKTNTGIMITGSHNPPEYNGFKIVINAKTLTSKQIQDLYKRIMDRKFSKGNGKLTSKKIQSHYLTTVSYTHLRAHET